MWVKRAGAAVVAAAIGTLLLAPTSGAKPDEGQAAPRTLERPARIAGPPKLESRLAPVAQAAPARALGRARSAGLDTAGGKVRVMVEGTGAARAAVATAGGTVESAAPGLLEALVPAAALDELSRSAGVSRVRAPFHAAPLGIDSEAVLGTSASAWHTAGAKGSGAKVAVVDLGFRDYESRRDAGELPAGLMVQDYCGGTMGAPEPHGTAVAEIVHEMAPEAQLYLICIDTEADLFAAKEYAKANGITIVNHSVGWYNTARGDGSGGATTPDGIVADARANGILWVNAAGNAAQEHWSGTFSDPDGSFFHNWTATDETNTIVLLPGEQVCGFLKWDSWPTTTQDYDLLLGWHAHPDPTDPSYPFVAGSVNNQADFNLPPTEAFCYTNPQPSPQPFFFAIAKYSATVAPRFDLFITIGNAMEYRNASGSVVEPATSPNAFAAGAICWSGNGLEPYSSQGPTIDGRVKPDIAGQAAVTSGVYGAFLACGTSGFTGTSASAPHVAGAAALWKGLMPLASSDAIKSFLQADSSDLGVTGLDSLFGSGALRLPAAAPFVETSGGGALPTRTSATVGGGVNAGGVPTTYYWEYGLTTAYGSQTAPVSAGSGRTLQSFTTTLTGLSAGTTYHFRFVATNMFGTRHGANATVTTLPVTPPGAVTGDVASIGARRATFGGAVNPNGAETTYYFEYGPTTAYGSQTAPVSAGSGAVPVAVTQTVSGLQPNTDYHVRLVATSADGTADGGDRAFRTLGSTAPVATTGIASAVTSSSALIAGTVNPGGEETTYQVEYGLTSAYGSLAPVPAAGAGFGGTPVGVSVPLTGLAASKTYHYRLVAANSNGRHEGADATFTTSAAPPPPPPGGGGGGGGGGPSPDFALTIGHSPTVVAVGDTFTYTFLIANKANMTGTEARLDVTLPAGVEYVSATFERGSGCRQVSGQSYSCFLDFLMGLQSTTIRAVVRLRQPGEQRLTAALHLRETDQNPADNAATYVFTAGAPLTPPATPPAGPKAPTGVTRTGTARPDVLRGTAGPDTLRGLGGNDRLYGGSAGDRLFGGAGDDRLEGHKGADLLDGGAGNDTILARDKAVDTVRCGPGRDVVTADRNDRVAKDCEVIRRG